MKKWYYESGQARRIAFPREAARPGDVHAPDPTEGSRMTEDEFVALTPRDAAAALWPLVEATNDPLKVTRDVVRFVRAGVVEYNLLRRASTEYWNVGPVGFSGGTVRRFGGLTAPEAAALLASVVAVHPDPVTTASALDAIRRDVAASAVDEILSDLPSPDLSTPGGDQ